MMTQSKSILCVVSEEQQKEYAEEFEMLCRTDASFIFYSSSDTALTKAGEINPQLIIAGMELQPFDGLEFMAMIMNKYPNYEREIILIPDKSDGIPPVVHSRRKNMSNAAVDGISFEYIAKLISEIPSDDSGNMLVGKENQDEATSNEDATAQGRSLFGGEATASALFGEEAASDVEDISTEDEESEPEKKESNIVALQPSKSRRIKIAIGAAAVLIMLGIGGGVMMLSTGDDNSASSKESPETNDNSRAALSSSQEDVSLAEKAGEQATSETKESAKQITEASSGDDAAAATATPDNQQNAAKVSQEVIELPFDFKQGETKPLILDSALLAETINKLQSTDATLELVGHTSAEGDASSNLELGSMRARNVMKILVRRGIPGNRFRLASVGENLPIASNELEKERHKNRRVTVTILSE